MSLLADGTAAPHPLELTLSTLEAALPAAAPRQDPLRGTHIPSNPLASSPELDDATMDKLLDGILSQV